MSWAALLTWCLREMACAVRSDCRCLRAPEGQNAASGPIYIGRQRVWQRDEGLDHIKTMVATGLDAARLYHTP